jgi:hypothetical protein
VTDLPLSGRIVHLQVVALAASDATPFFADAKSSPSVSPTGFWHHRRDARRDSIQLFIILA